MRDRPEGVRIRVLSDLHREMGTVDLPDAAAVVVLADDIDHGSKGVGWARQAFPCSAVLHVAGNCEYTISR